MGILFTIYHKNVIISDELLASQNLTLYFLFLQQYIDILNIHHNAPCLFPKVVHNYIVFDFFLRRL